MNTRTLIAVVLLAAAGYNYWQPASSALPQAPPDAPKSTRHPGGHIPGEDGPDALIAKYFTKPIQFVIASVPDPDATALRLYTDRSLDMLELAANQHGYHFVKSWIPWHLSLDPMDERYTERKQQLQDFKQLEKSPGVLLFRKYDHPPGYFSKYEAYNLAILVVPETPTGGIELSVLEVALDIVLRYDGQAGLVGPSFTSGMMSLREFLAKSAKAANVVTQVVAGPISGVTAKRRNLTWMVPFRWVCAQEVDIKAHLTTFLKTFRGEADVIELVEDSTALGNVLINDKDTTDHKPILFPWQISRLRNATPEGSLRLNVPQAVQRGVFGLPLQFQDPRQTPGEVPTYAAGQTPAGQEAILAQVSEKLGMFDGHYSHLISIVSSDVLDWIFLAQLLTKANPDERLITTEPDTLVLRSQDVLAVAGILAPATFPISNHLRLKDDFPRKENGTELPTMMFDSQYSRSVFEAAYEVIDGTPIIACPQQLKKRPTWLMAHGRNGYWPVARIDDQENVSAELEYDPPTLLWMIVFQVSFVASILWLTLILAARPGPAARLVELMVSPRRDRGENPVPGGVHT